MPTTKERVTDIGYRGYKAFINKIWYPFLTRRLDTQDVTFLNYGYEGDPPLNLPLDENDAANRYSINLYNQVASQIDLAGKKVLECSCGHGGGASYIVRTFKPAEYTGLDYNPDGVAYCNEHHKLPGLNFVHGNAEDLPFPDELLRRGRECRSLTRLSDAVEVPVRGGTSPEAGRKPPLRRLPRPPRIPGVGGRSRRDAAASGVQAGHQRRRDPLDWTPARRTSLT